jgi:hypothetical protein
LLYGSPLTDFNTPTRRKDRPGCQFARYKEVGAVIGEHGR